MASDPSHLYSETQAVRKIIVVDLGFLGDTVHLIPALWEIKRNYPRASLHVLSSTLGAEVLRLAPCVDRAWAVELHPARRTWRQHGQVIRDLRQERFDVAYNLGGADRSIILTGLTRARWKVAHEGGRKHFWNRWLIQHWVLRRDPALPAYEQRRRVLAACGLSLAAPRWDLQIPAEAVRRAETLAPPGALHFSINASTPLKEWPLEHWITLAKQLLAATPSLHILAGGSSELREQERLRALAQGVADQRLVLLPPNLSIAELAAAVQRCRLHLGGDSGVLHLAVAIGTPTLSLFRQYHDASAWIPTDATHRVLTAPCPCLNQAQPECAVAGKSKCLETINPATVAKLIDSFSLARS